MLAQLVGWVRHGAVLPPVLGPGVRLVVGGGLRGLYRRLWRRPAQGAPRPVRADAGGALLYAMTPAGVKVHRLRADGKTVCGFGHLQLVLAEDPLPHATRCEWCWAAGGGAA